MHRYFHVPVALFGSRTAYPGRFGSLEALATDGVLEDGMPVILDAAPVYEGYTVDTSYAFNFGKENLLQRQLLLALAPLRELILKRVCANSKASAPSPARSTTKSAGRATRTAVASTSAPCSRSA